MGLSAKELTELSKHTSKARRNLDNLLDFIDLMNKEADKLEKDISPAGDHIKQLSDEMSKHVEEIRDIIDTQLDKIPIDPEELKKAASNLDLYHGNVHQVIAWANTQKSNYKEGSYWWRYWVGILENVMQQEAENPSKPIGKDVQFMEKIK